ncbi:MAG TPA: galactose ABC transporter substrate-binding protein [Lachnospiraceae bacterium]|nr:galactose ABC transporter substrate-binding protein [Lachnospiraceae bacterium]
MKDIGKPGKVQRMKRKGLGGIVCACLLALSCWGCAGDEKNQAEELRVGVLLYNQDDLFIGALKQEIDGCFRETEKREGCRITVSYFDSMGNQITQNEQIDTFIEQGYDVLCVNLVVRTDAAAIVDKGKKADVPLVFFNREPVSADLERWEKIYYVGTDAEEGGRKQGEIFLDYCRARKSADKNGDGVIQYVLLEGEPGHQDSAIRTESCIKSIEEGGVELERLAVANANWRRSQGKEKMAGWLDEFGSGIEAVISNNDAMALGALDALAESDLAELSPVVIGLDGIEEARAAVRDGRMAGTVVNDARGQAEAIVALATELGKDEIPDIPDMKDRIIRVPHKTVTQ